MKKLLFANHGIAEADPATVAVWFRRSIPGHQVPESVDQAVFAYQGGWWYRGETTVAPDPRGTHITTQVFNVATWLPWAVPLANRFFIGARGQYTEAFTSTLDQLAADLEVRAYVIR